MFEQKINTVSIRVNEESFAVVPFDNYEDAIKAAKQALVALNSNDAMQSLIDRLCSVEMALAEEKARNTTVLRIDGKRLAESFTLEKLEALSDPLGILDRGNEIIREFTRGATHEFKVWEPPKEAAAETEKEPAEPITWGYQDGDLPMVITRNAETARDWAWEGKKVFEIQRKPINY